jgi:Fe-S cluster assembly protein SufD
MTLTEFVNERPTTGTPAERFTSRDPDAFEVPRGREEQWRFTPVRRLRGLFEPFTPTGQVTTAVEAPEGVSATIVPASDGRVGRISQPADRVSSLAFAGAAEALLVEIEPGREFDEAVYVHASATAGTVYAHLVIEAKPHSQATVVVDYAGGATVAENVEVIVGSGARLTFVTLQDWASDAVHLSAHDLEVGRDAALKHVVVNLGGDVVRIAPTLRFAGPGGSADLLGVNFAGRGQHLESRLYVDHSLPECTSEVLYKNALLGDTARTVWIGDVRIRPAATGTNTYEMNRNLLLSDGARADSVPNLEIETGDILGAGHASATGRFDDLQLFYLQSRGIGAEEAQRLVVRGFFADVVDRIGVPPLQRAIMTAIEARLGFTSIIDDPELETAL